MSFKTLNVSEETHRKAKLLSALTGLSMAEMLEIIIEGMTDKEILKLAKKKAKEKELSD